MKRLNIKRWQKIPHASSNQKTGTAVLMTNLRQEGLPDKDGTFTSWGNTGGILSEVRNKKKTSTPSRPLP